MSDEETDTYQEVAMRSMSHGTGLMFYVDGELYRGEASISFYYGRGTGEGKPNAVSFSNVVDPKSKVFVVSLNKGKLRELRYNEAAAKKNQTPWEVQHQEGGFDW